MSTSNEEDIARVTDSVEGYTLFICDVAIDRLQSGDVRGGELLRKLAKRINAEFRMGLWRKQGGPK